MGAYIQSPARHTTTTGRGTSPHAAAQGAAAQSAKQRGQQPRTQTPQRGSTHHLKSPQHQPCRWMRRLQTIRSRPLTATGQPTNHQQPTQPPCRQAWQRPSRQARRQPNWGPPSPTSAKCRSDNASCANMPALLASTAGLAATAGPGTKPTTRRPGPVLLCPGTTTPAP